MRKTPTCYNKWRLCHTAIEDVTHDMWYVLVLKCQQDIIYPYAMAEWEKTLYISHIQKHFPEAKVEQIQELEYIRRVKQMWHW